MKNTNPIYTISLVGARLGTELLFLTTIIFVFSFLPYIWELSLSYYLELFCYFISCLGILIGKRWKRTGGNLIIIGLLAVLYYRQGPWNTSFIIFYIVFMLVGLFHHLNWWLKRTYTIEEPTSKIKSYPLWKKILVYIVIYAASSIGYIGFSLTLVQSREPAVTVDYLKILNETTKPKLDESQNSWPYYQQASEKLVKPNETLKNIPIRSTTHFHDLNKDEKQLVRQWVKDNELAWQMYLQGSQKTYFWREYRLKNENKSVYDPKISLMAKLVVDFKPMRDLAIVGGWNAKINIENNRWHEAEEICLGLIRTGKQLQNERNTIIGQLVGIAISNIGSKAILELCAHIN